MAAVGSRFYALTESFLAKHLGGRSRPIGDDFKGWSLKVETGGGAGAGDWRGSSRRALLHASKDLPWMGAPTLFSRAWDGYKRRRE
jgi:hypothetical protein